MGIPMSADKTDPRQRVLNQVKDKPGEFALLAKTDLVIDHSYQRDASEDRIRGIARDWTWVACGVIIVALREADNTWAVVDGQHRVMAALLRDDITHLPCMVFLMEDVCEEARAFLAANTWRRPITAVGKNRALVRSHDHVATVVNDLVTATGRRVSQGGHPGIVSCLGALMDACRDNEQRFRQLWPVISELCTGKKVTSQLVRGLFYLEEHLQGASLADKHWRVRLMQVGYDAVDEAMSKSGAFHQVLNGKTAALGIAVAVNHGLRNKLQHSIRVED